MKRFAFFGILTVLLLSACQRRYTNTAYHPSVIDNKTIAVLPYEVITTGRVSNKVTPEMMTEIEEGESQAFQASLYHQILNRLDSRKYQHLEVRVQSFNETNKIIQAAGYSIRESWDLPAQELAEILKVDAVVSSQVHKTQYLTDLESYGIHLARDLFWLLSDRSLWFIPYEKTSDVRIYSSIIDANDGHTLWAASRKCPTDWNWQTQDVIEKVNYRISKKLPR